MPTINDIATIPEVNRNQFKAFLMDLDASTHEIEISYNTSTVNSNQIRFEYTAVCDTHKQAVEIRYTIREGAMAHGGH